MLEIKLGNHNVHMKAGGYYQNRVSPSPLVFCEIYEYCMTFEETVSPDKRTLLTHFRK